jgi:transposase
MSMGTKRKRATASTAAVLKASPAGQTQQASQLLGRLTTVTLRRLLVQKKVLLRSKYKTKAGMIGALASIVDPDEIEKLVENMPSPVKTASPAPCVPWIDQEHILRIEGKRWDDPVMAIDVHKEPLAWAVVDPEGLVDEQVTENTVAGIQPIIAACHVHGVKMVVMESTAEYWLLPYWTLMEAGIPVMVVNSKQTKAIMGVKTDKLDARRIAFALRDGRLKPSIACNREQYALRKDMREMVDHVELATRCVQQIQQMFHKADAPELVSKSLNSHRGLSIIAALAGCNTRAELLDIVKVEYSAYKGKIEDPVTLDLMTDAYWNFAIRVKRNGDMERLAMALDDYTTHEEKTWILQRNGIIYAKQHLDFLEALRLLVTFTGIDTRTALPILAEIVDARYFADARKLSKWAGIVPATSQSGYRKRINGKIYKGGNKYLRRAVWLVAQRVLGMPSHPVRRFMLHLINDKQKPKMKAITAGAHKILTIIHTMLVRKQPFTIIANNDALERQERNTKRKWSKLDHIMAGIAEADILPRLVPRLKAKLESCANMERLVNELAASLLGDSVVARYVNEKGGG